MLYLITGKPGNGKTLLMLATVHKLQKDTGRPVFYNGVPLTEVGRKELGWTEFEGLEQATRLDDDRLRIWPQLPDGAIAVVDEAQRYWRARPQGSTVPLPVCAMETHRHFGLDIFLLTQDPKLIDINVRKLVWEHSHVKRTFGLEKATISRWKQRTGSVDSKSDYADALEEAWTYPKAYYGWYQSAEVHTAGKQLPWKQISKIGALLAAAVAAGAWVYVSFSSKVGQDVASDDVAEMSTGGTHKSVGRGKRSGGNPWDSVTRRPRVAGIEQSAPLYDELQRAVAQPKIAGCLELRYSTGTLDCRCATSQGSRVDVTARECRRLIKTGWFDPTKADVDVKAENIAYLNSKDAAGGGVGIGSSAGGAGTRTSARVATTTAEPASSGGN